jgi:hypothetical protein
MDMLKGRFRGWVWILLSFGAGWACLEGAMAESQRPLIWMTPGKNLSAEIRDVELLTVLQSLSKVTGWQIRIQPGAQRQVQVAFQNASLGDALRMLLDDFNFALLPGGDSAPQQLFIYDSSIREATELITFEEVNSGPGAAIPNELIVTLDPGSGSGIEDLARELGAKVVGSVEGLNSYRLQFENEEAARAAREHLEKRPELGGVDSNFALDRPRAVDDLRSGLGEAFPLRPKLNSDSGEVIIGLLDTPVQLLEPQMQAFLLPSIHVAGEPLPDAGDQLTHGTSMAQTLLRGLTMAPLDPDGSAVRVLPVDVYGPNADTTTFEIAKGIYEAVNAGASIINLSMGGEGDSRFLNDLIREAKSHGVLFFGSAGNSPTTALVFPAAYPEVVAVTAADRDGNIASYANRGSFVDLIAPGSSIVYLNGQPYRIEGTSASTAYVSGHAAGFKAMGKSAAEIEAYLREILAMQKP